MVLYIESYEWIIEGLRRWRRRADVVFLVSTHWSSSINPIFYSIESGKGKGIYMKIEYATTAAAVIQYFFRPNRPNFTFKVKTQQRVYYDCYECCAGLSSLNHICMADNSYLSHDLSGLSLSPPLSLSTIVPTQLSSLV